MNEASARSSRASAPFQHHEARAGKLRGGLEIHQAERLAELEMLLRLKRKLRRFADLAQNLVGAGVRPDRHVGCGRVGNGGEQRSKLVVEPLLARLARLDRVLEACDLVHEALRRRLVLLRLGVADLLGGGVAARLRLLQFLNRRAAFLVEAEKAIQRRARVVEAAIGQPLDEGVLDCRGSI